MTIFERSIQVKGFSTTDPVINYPPMIRLDGTYNTSGSSIAMSAVNGGYMTITGSGAANGNLILQSTQSGIKGKVLIDEVTDSTTTTTGALVVSGGVGIAERLTVGKTITAAVATADTHLCTFKQAKSTHNYATFTTGAGVAWDTVNTIVITESTIPAGTWMFFVNGAMNSTTASLVASVELQTSATFDESKRVAWTLWLGGSGVRSVSCASGAVVLASATTVKLFVHPDRTAGTEPCTGNIEVGLSVDPDINVVVNAIQLAV